MKQRYFISIITDRVFYHVDTYPNNFKCWYLVTDNKTGKDFRRRGYGKFIGNFAPVWITINRVRKQVEEWLQETF